MLSEVAAVESVNPGDEILVHRNLGLRVVSSVQRYDDGAFVVVYFDEEEATFENKARAKRGPRSQRRLVLKGIVPKAAGDVVQVVRGAPARAERLRAQLEREQAERWARFDSWAAA